MSNYNLNSNKLEFYIYGDFISNYAMHEKSFSESYSVEDFNKLRCSIYSWLLDRLRAQEIYAKP